MPSRVGRRTGSPAPMTTHQTIRATLVALALLPVASATEQQPRPIPDGKVAMGTQDIKAAWLSEATRRYPHGVLGDQIEAGTLLVEGRDGEHHSIRLADESVFEDITPRLADIDGDGKDEVWTVRSDASAGARLEAYALTEGALVLRYATAPIGQGFRWLNPVGIADFNGNGRREAAYVETPHIGGVLTIVKPVGNKLLVVTRQAGYSTHTIGSTWLDLAAIANLDDQQGMEIVLPDQSRDRLAAVSLVGDTLIERWRSEQLPVVAGGLSLVRNGGNLDRPLPHRQRLAAEGNVTAGATPSTALGELTPYRHRNGCCPGTSGLGLHPKQIADVDGILCLALVQAAAGIQI